MLNKLRQHKENNKGFTIIEVMVVLAIAGIILIIVLLAIPALQRNSRNTSMKNDVGAVSGAINEYVSNNDGSTPTTTSSSCASDGSTKGSSVKFNSTSTDSNGIVPKIQGTTAVKCSNTAATITPVAGEINVVFGYKCPASASGTSVTLGNSEKSNRSSAIIYAAETSSSTQAKCTES